MRTKVTLWDHVWDFNVRFWSTSKGTRNTDFVFCLYSICWAMDRKLIPNFSWQCYFIYHTFSLFCRQFLLRRYCASSVGSHCVTTAKSYHTVKIKASCWERFQKRYLFCLQRIVPDDTQTLTFYQWSRLQSLIRIGFHATTFCRFFNFFFFVLFFFIISNCINRSRFTFSNQLYFESSGSMDVENTIIWINERPIFL